VVIGGGGIDTVGGRTESNSPDVVVFSDVVLGLAGVGLIEGDQDQIV